MELPTPGYRPRRMRVNGRTRAFIGETRLDISDFIYPLFVKPGFDCKDEVTSMPGVYQFSIDRLDEEIDEIVALGLSTVILFGLPEHKDSLGSDAILCPGITDRKSVV